MANEVDEFLSGLKGNQDNDPFKPESNDPFENLSSKEEVKEEKGEEAEDEKQLPFHKDPKIQDYIEKQIDKRMAEHKPTEAEKFKEEVKVQEDEVDSVLARIIGNDTPEKLSAIKDLKKVITTREDSEEAKEAIQYMKELRASQEATLEAENEVEQGFESIKETSGIDLDAPQASKLRNDFIDFVQKISPKDEEGNIVQYPDFTESFNVFQEMNKKPVSNSRNKELASKSISRASDASNAPVTGDKSWKAVERLFGKLSV